MKKILVVLFLVFNTLMAHSHGEEHMHFLSSLHIEEFGIFLVVMVLGFFVFNYFKKKAN